MSFKTNIIKVLDDHINQQWNSVTPNTKQDIADDIAHELNIALTYTTGLLKIEIGKVEDRLQELLQNPNEGNHQNLIDLYQDRLIHYRKELEYITAL